MKYDFQRMVALLSAFSGTLLIGVSSIPVSAQTTPENAQRPYSCEEFQQQSGFTYTVPAGVSARDQDEKANDVLHLYQRGKAQARITDFDVYEATFRRNTLAREASGTQTSSGTSTVTQEYSGRQQNTPYR